MEEGRWIGILLPTPAPTMGKVAWVRLPLFTAPLLQVGRTLFLREGGAPKHQMVLKMVQAQNTKDPNSLQCFRCQGWGHMARECTTLAKMLNRNGGPEGMWSNPPPAAVNKLATFHS